MLRIVFLFTTILAAVVGAAEPARPFSATLTAEQRQRLGLAGLSPAQWAELDAAIGGYARGETSVAVQQAVRQVEQKSEAKVQAAEKKAQVAEQKAAVAAEAVAEAKKPAAGPGLVARTLDVFKKKPAEDKGERFTARVVGPFRGWGGGTYFPLENGQVWKQVGTESNELPVVQNAEVEIYASGNGYWRLRYGGAWITVKRLQ